MVAPRPLPDPRNQQSPTKPSPPQYLTLHGEREKTHDHTDIFDEDGFLIVPYGPDDDDSDDDGGAFAFVDPEFLDFGWGAACLQDIEDIDFDFVYALRTFVASVEGQANATKGDTMVLLDDSNSYWWLVRVVKDSSIGYLPAEHIETPTERLARLNKHRNIDVGKAHSSSRLPLTPGTAVRNYALRSG